MILTRFVSYFIQCWDLQFFEKHEDSDDYDGVASSPLKSRRVVKPKKKRGDDRALIESGRLVESKMGDLYASATSDTSKRKLVNHLQFVHMLPLFPSFSYPSLPQTSRQKVQISSPFRASP
jgi:hypothetical protein